MRISDLSSDVCSSDLAQGDADVVEALEEALLGGVVEREGHLEADGRRREGPGADVDDDPEGGIRLDGGEELISDLGAHLHRHEAVLAAVVAEAVGEAGAADGTEAVVHDLPHAVSSEEHTYALKS